MLLDHRGYSDTQARMDILNQFKEAFGLDKSCSFSADREFVGNEWTAYRLNHNSPFFIRIKENMWANLKSNECPLCDFLDPMKIDERPLLYGHLDDERTVIIGKKLKDKSLVICSNVKDKDHVLQTY